MAPRAGPHLKLSILLPEPPSKCITHLTPLYCVYNQTFCLSILLLVRTLTMLPSLSAASHSFSIPRLEYAAPYTSLIMLSICMTLRAVDLQMDWAFLARVPGHTVLLMAVSLYRIQQVVVLLAFQVRCQQG